VKKRILKIVLIVVAIQAAMAALAQIVRWLYPSFGDEESNEINLLAPMYGIDLTSHAAAFRGGSAKAIMGGINLDLRDATLDANGAQLTLTTIMGGIQLHVPPDWDIQINALQPLIGGIDAPGAGIVRDRPALTLTVRCIMGGVQIIGGSGSAGEQLTTG
jgi:hypothetical protein